MAVAALQLGRAHELRGDAAAAAQAYRRARRLAEADEEPAGRLYERIAAQDVVLACEARLRQLDS